MLLAPIAQWIERIPAEDKMRVQFPLGAPFKIQIFLLMHKFKMQNLYAFFK